MEDVQLGRSGMKISQFILGTLTFSGTNGFEALGNVDVERGRRMVDMAIDAGINTFDAANPDGPRRFIAFGTARCGDGSADPVRTRLS